MKYRVRVGDQAQADMIEITRYIRVQLQAPQTAAKIYRMIKSEIKSLNEMPERYPYDSNERVRAFGIRNLLVGNYKVLYLVEHESPIVHVVRVIYAGRDMDYVLDNTDLGKL